MISIKSFRQTPGYCGPASMKMVLNYYGIHKSEAAIAKLSECSRRYGVNEAGLIIAAKKFGLKYKIKDNSSFEDIKIQLKMGRPVIVSWFAEEVSHFSVVIKITNNYIFFKDPEIGRTKKMTQAKFRSVWFSFDSIYPTKDRMALRRMLVLWK